MDEVLDACHILEGWSRLEARIEVDADKLGMVERLDLFCIVDSDASRDEEGGLARVVPEDVPVELLTAAAIALTFGLEEEVVYKIRI